MRAAFPAHPTVPISKAMRAGDFIFTSAYGPWTFDPKDVVFDRDGRMVSDGTDLEGMPFDEQVHRTFGFIKDALETAGSSLVDVVDCQCWLADARDFVRFNAIYREYFTQDPPVRSVFPSPFMFLCKVEMKVIAYRPLARF